MFFNVLFFRMEDVPLHLESAPPRLSGRNVLVLMLLNLLASSCANNVDATDEVIFEVNSFRVPCVGMAPMSCLQVRRGDDAAGEWQSFYAPIRGFDYEPGYLYRLRIRETTLPPGQVPADASSIRYDLVEVIDKEPDPRLAIQDIWVLDRLDRISIDDFDPASRGQSPSIEFNVVLGEYLGNDGCNAFRGDIVTVGPEELTLGPPTSTDGAGGCGDGSLQAQFAAALTRITRWRRDGLSLALADDHDAEVLVFRKVD